MDECYDAYSVLAEKYNICLLNNNMYIKTKYRDEPQYAICGGIGFSKYNEQYNVNNLCYSKDLIQNRNKEITESEIFLYDYKQFLKEAKKLEIPLIVASHCPIDDWSLPNEIDFQCIYFYGHNHQNKYVRNKFKTIFADNQIGYKNDIKMKFCELGCRYDPFIAYPDGYHEISVSDYDAYYRYIGETLNEPILIKKLLKNQANKFYLIKHDEYYGFFITTKKGTRICQGGRTKTISKINDITYFDIHFLDILNIFVSAIKPYRMIQEQIAEEVRQLGLDGTIHGCIIDSAFYYHIMLNPYDGAITFYYSPIFGAAQSFESIEKFLASINKMKLNCFETTVKEISTQKRILKTMQKNNALICRPVNTIQEYINKTVHIDIKNSLYSTSRKINQLQRLFNANLLRDWNDELIQSLIEDSSEYKIQPTKLNNFQLVRKHWKNILDIPENKINEKLIRTALKGNKKYIFPYLNYQMCSQWYAPSEKASDEEITQFISIIPIEMLKADDIYAELLSLLKEDTLKFYPSTVLSTNRVKQYVDLSGFKNLLFNLRYIESLLANGDMQNYINSLLIKNLKDTIENIECIPTNYRDERLYQTLGSNLTHKRRPQWCPNFIWKYRKTQ